MAVERNGEFDQPLLLLGAQRDRPRLAAILDQWHLPGPLALVAPGWEEDEIDDGWVREAVGGRTVVNLQLYELADRLFAEDPEVIQLLRQRQDELRRLRDVNQLQLDHHMIVARDLIQREFAGEPVATQLATALRHLREVDREYLELVTEVIRNYDKRIDPWARPSVQRYRQRILERCAPCSTLLIAGGHVGVLLNRLNLSRLLRHVHLPVIAWSGGAMAMTDKVVFFHQGLPHATGNVEVSRRGVSWLHSHILFPRAAERLSLADRREVALLARRFGDDACVLLEGDTQLEWSAGRWVRWEHVLRLHPDGSIREWAG